MEIKILCVLIGLCCVGYCSVMIQEMIATPYQLELKKLSRWLSHAGSIVSSDRSFARDRFRGSIQFAVATTGRALTDEQFQAVLKDLAQSTAVNILDSWCYS